MKKVDRRRLCKCRGNRPKGKQAWNLVHVVSVENGGVEPWGIWEVWMRPKEGAWTPMKLVMQIGAPTERKQNYWISFGGTPDPGRWAENEDMATLRKRLPSLVPKLDAFMARHLERQARLKR